MPKVAVIKATPENILDNIKVLCDLAGMKEGLVKNKPVIIKDNISWHMPFLSANTTPWQLEGAILALKAAGFAETVAVHNDTVVTDPYKGLRLNKLDRVYKKFAVEEKFNFKKEDIGWIEYKPSFKTRALHKIYDRIMIPGFFMGKNILHLPTLKTHIYTTTTGAMKNAFGGLLGTHRHYAHTWIHEILVDLLKIQQDIHCGIFSIMDATICGCGPGPRTMVPLEKGYMLAGSDSVAIDAVAAKMMGFNPLDIPYLRMAHDDGIGVADPKAIDIVGEDISGVDFRFFVGENLAAKIGKLLWFGHAKEMQRLFFRTPLVYLFVFASFLYHDYMWWPTVGKARQKKVLKTPWGKLFKEY